MVALTQGSIPEVKETEPRACLRERTERIRNFTDLGPPDLVNLLKYNSNQKQQTISTFLYYTGVDTTSSSSIAAHLNLLANVISSTSQIWFGKPKHWKVQQATYAVYNVFSKVDTRVTVHIPGKVETMIIDSKGEPIQETDRLWLETFVSATIRSLLSCSTEEEEINPVVECRNLNPFPTIELARQFLDAYEVLFFEGPKLGCDIDVQIPTLVSNYFTDCFMKTLELTNEYDYGLGILERLKEKDTCVLSLIANVYFMKDQEVKAINMLYNSIQLRPRDANLLMLQTEYCIKKEMYDFALTCATHAVKASPSEYKPWSLLVKVYTIIGDFENALLTLNSCPMIPHRDKFHLRRVVGASPESMHLPLPIDATLDEVSALNAQDVAAEHQSVDPNLLSLPAANLKSTFAKAYELLTEIVHRTGWEQLLKYRAKVFVMEEEYRKDKSKSSSKNASTENQATPNPEAVKSPEVPDTHSDNNEETSILQAFKKKRLCERWLDNLFMLLYEDLRAFKMWQAEFIHFQSQRLVYKKNTLEWELLGSIAYRLHNYKEASGAFSNALSGRFSVKSTKKLLTYYQDEKKSLIKQSLQTSNGNSNGPNGVVSNDSTPKLNGGSKKPLSSHQIQKRIQTLDAKILDAIVKLAVWNHRWYREFDILTIQALKDLIEEDGLIKVRSQVQALYVTDKNGVGSLLEDYFSFLKSIHSYGVAEKDDN
ncbi:exomer complex subunit [Saccharomycopsis crataegensis]|uniref:Exomer complex subunit n=1 Tax=Saccharomycopsis crataegensis TaxID=43959 RepID=A0AAV5QQ30_9ASCO|nr:exomer complex subunit [Saccharomycopsis crataegensis]